MELDHAFDEFFEAIALGALPEGRIASGWARLHDYLCSAYSRPSGNVFLQGSYANDTTVKPAYPTDEYDVDVIALCAGATDTSDEALLTLEATLAKDADYRQGVVRKTPCVRLQYASDESGYLHFDVVPARRCSTSPLEIPRRGDGWKGNDPEGYRRWCLNQGQQFIRTVRMLKRWRDIHQGQRRGVRSVVLQVLVAQAMPAVARDAHAVAGAFRGVAERLAPHMHAPPTLPHPTLPSENLTANWPADDYRLFRDHVMRAADEASAALSETDESSSHDRWRALLGDAFPPYDRSPRRPPIPPPGYPSTPQHPPRHNRYG